MKLPSDFLSKYGPWAVITGSSSGIGAEFAGQLAAAGLSLVLVARRKDRLDAAAEQLMEEYPIQVKTLGADLTTPQGVQSVIDFTSGIDVGLLMANAGMALHGTFFRDPSEKHEKMIALNVTAPTTLAHAFGKRLGNRGKGGIVFTSSMAQSGFPSLGSYSATKAYVSKFSVLLRLEMKKVGVDVLSLEPGLVQTEMVEQVYADGVNFAPIGMHPMSAKDCVSEALKALYDGKATCLPGLMNKIMAGMTSWLPEQLRLNIMDKAMDRAMPKEQRIFPQA